MYLNEFSQSEKIAFYSLAQLMVAADGVIQESEQFLLSQLTAEMRLDKKEISLLSFEAAIDCFSDSEPSVRKKAYLELVGLAMCDEKLEEKENALLKRIVEGFSLSREEAGVILDCVLSLTDIYRRIAQAVS